MSVVENLRIGAYLRTDKAEIEKDVQWVYSLFPRLEERSWQLAGTVGQELRAGAGDGDVAGLQHVGLVRDLQGHVGVLLDQPVSTPADPQGPVFSPPYCVNFP